MKLLKLASLLTAIAILSVPVVIAAEAAETAKATLKDAKGEDVGSVSLMQTSAGVLLQLSLKGVPAGEHAFHIGAVTVGARGRRRDPSPRSVRSSTDGARRALFRSQALAM